MGPRRTRYYRATLPFFSSLYLTPRQVHFLPNTLHFFQVSIIKHLFETASEIVFEIVFGTVRFETFCSHPHDLYRTIFL